MENNALVPVAQKKAGGQMTPREIVRELDRYIIGQTDAKKAVAVALRNATDENRRKRILWRFARHPMISLRMLKHKKCRKPKQIPCEEADLARLASLLAEN